MSAPSRRALTWIHYAGAVVVGPYAFFALTYAMFGFKGIDPADPAAIPGFVALAVPPVIGIFLGWRLSLVERWHPRTALTVAAPIVVLAFPVLLVATVASADYYYLPSLEYLAGLGLAAVYVIGPVILGRFLRLVWEAARGRAT